MGTRSYIAYEKDDGTVRASFCKNDSQLESAGEELIENYNTLKDAIELVDKGPMVGVGQYFEADDNPDHVEDFIDVESLLDDSVRDEFIEVVYIFLDGEGWQVACTNCLGDATLEDLSDELKDHVA